MFAISHGIYRAKSDADRDWRRSFGEELRRGMVVHPVTVEIAELAGRIEGEQAAALDFMSLRQTSAFFPPRGDARYTTHGVYVGRESWHFLSNPFNLLDRGLFQ